MMIVGSLAILAGLGIAFGVGLAVASKLLHVEVDPRIARIAEVLPGVNCGGCGYAGCNAYAEALVNEGASPSDCSPGGEEVAAQIAEVLGVEAVAAEKMLAVLRCRGRVVPSRFTYDGLHDCRAANLLQAGPKGCGYGCLGFGTCAEACPFGAIKMVDQLSVIDEEKCVGCGKCVDACPRRIIALRRVEDYVEVLCLSQDKGGMVRKICELGCLGCKKCEKACKFDAISVDNFLAQIDFEKCIACGKCVKECPVGVIANFRKERKARQKAKEGAAAQA